MNPKLLPLALVPIVIWAGLFFYMLIVDRRLARLEQERSLGTETDDL